MIGTKLGPYEITAKLGEGGMGEVYRAHDTKLKRDVAIKVLPATFTEDKERLQRFEREAQLLAQLHHPNIASIFGLEESDGTRALIMELVEGPTLAERLESGALPFNESLSVSLQIAQALEEAHEKGIVHRDLKPQNIKASIEGKVKVLDFGLAKAMDPAAGSAVSAADLGRSPTLMNSPTLTAVQGTQLGVILGTAAYMAPEQAKGLPIDKRADIWAFGVVLFEMLSGRSLFAGDTVTDTLAGVLKSEIDFSRLPESTPAAIRRLLRRCLERNPKNRLHDIADARIVLEELASGRAEEGRGSSEAGASAPPHSSASRWLPWIVAAAGLAIGIFGWLRPQHSSSPVGTQAVATRFVVPPPGPGEIVGYPALSPDGRTMAYCFAAERGVPRLWLHEFETGLGREVPGTELAEQPFWSPDGRHVGFLSRGQLRTLDVATGHLEAVAPAADARGATWSDSGEIVFSATCCSGLSAVPATGGAVRVLTRLDTTNGETSHRYPWMSPGGESLFYTVPNGQRVGIHWHSVESGATQLLAPLVARAVFDPRGYLLWTRDGSLVARRFDVATGTFGGESFVVAQRVGTDPNKSAQDLFATAGGVVAVRPQGNPLRELRWFDRSGAPAQLVGSADNYFDPMFSPDRRRVAVAKSSTANYFAADIWILDSEGSDRATRLTFTGSTSAPAWSSDGATVYYSSEGGGRNRILAKRADGSGQEEVLLDVQAGMWLDDVSRREPRLLLEGTAESGSYKLWFASLAGERTLEPFQHESAGSQTHAAFSPDGRLVAFSSDESGTSQIYVQAIDGSPGRWQVSRDGGDLATWRADGKELYFVGFDRVLRAVAVKSLAPFAVGDEEALFPLRIPPLAITSQHIYYLPSADGRRFLVNQAADDSLDAGIQVTLGWSPPASAGAPQ
jgi:eukaryotic-like serine/threonine-protein kinase